MDRLGVIATDKKVGLDKDVYESHLLTVNEIQIISNYSDFINLNW